MFKLKGKVVKIFNPEVIETKGGNLYKQIVIIDKEGEYTNEIQFQFLNDKPKEFNFQEGQEGEMSFYINGRQWKDKYFVNLNGKEFVVDESISMGEHNVPIFDKIEAIEECEREFEDKITEEQKDKKDDLPF